MWFMHMHQLDTLYQSKGSKISSWVIWGHRGQKCEFLQLKRLNKKTNRFNSFFLLLLLLLLLLLSHNLLLLPHAWSDFDQTWSEWPVGEWLQKLCFVWPQRSCKGHRGQKGHFYGKCISSYMLYWILTKLGQKHQWVSGYKSYALYDLKGHVEVTGVKKVIYFSKCSDWAEISIQWSLWHFKHPKNIL